MSRELNFMAGGRTVVLPHDSGVRRQAEFLRSAIVESASEGFCVRHGARMQFGWSLLTFIDTDGVLVVHEPDFDHDPLTQIRADVTHTLVVQSMQSAVVAKVDATPEATLFDQKVICHEAAIDERNVYCQRQERASRDDSGWYVGLVSVSGVAEPNRLRSKRVFELVRDRIALSSVLMLPVGYVAVFSDQNITAILDGDDNNRWK